MRLDELFEVRNGLASSEVEVLSIRGAACIPYIRPASTQQRTVGGWVERSSVSPKHIYPSETLFVSTDGEGSHTYSYVSQFEFVPNSNVAVLIPKERMSVQEKIYYARCITMNRNRFSYGRKPKGERLKSIELPASVPAWAKKTNIGAAATDKLKVVRGFVFYEKPTVPTKTPSTIVKVRDIFDVSYGTSLELNRMTKCPGGINFVARTSKNNGVSARVATLPSIAPITGGALTVAGGGSVLETFLQLEPFYTGFHLFVLRPKEPMSVEELLFYAMCIRANRSRYSYGRQANRTLRDLSVPSRSAVPDWVYGSFNRVVDQIAERNCG